MARSLPLHQSLVHLRATITHWTCEACGNRKQLRGSEDHLDREMFIANHRGCYIPRVKVHLEDTESKEYRVGVDTDPRPC